MPDTRADRIRSALATLDPALVVVQDDSSKHAGHMGARPGGETHYSVLVVAEAFAGLGRVARHRMVNAALEGEFTGGLHALSLTLRTPAEHGAG
jgi:BolA family transcriptional regulator, general stress-responsive regulator